MSSLGLVLAKLRSKVCAKHVTLNVTFRSPSISILCCMLTVLTVSFSLLHENDKKHRILVRVCYLIQRGMDFPRLPIKGDDDPHHHILHTRT